MDSDYDKLRLMKRRILDSYGWKKDIIVPLSKEFKLSLEEMEDFFMDLMDMSSLESLHATFQTANSACLIKKFHIDLRLCFFQDNLELISKKQCKNLKSKLALEVEKGRPYDEVLEEGRAELLEIIKNNQ